MFNILILNGPNLNLLGTRETNIYGKTTLSQLNDLLNKESKKLNINISHFQSNAEHEIIEKIHASKKKIQYIIINPAAFTHTSLAIRDSLISVEIPFIEVHISNIYSRETFRTHSWFSDISSGTISGLGIEGYIWAIKTAAIRLFKKNKNKI